MSTLSLWPCYKYTQEMNMERSQLGFIAFNEFQGASCQMSEMSSRGCICHTLNKMLDSLDCLRLSNNLRTRRLQFAGHCFRANDEAVSQVILWTPTDGQRSRGRPATTYVDLTFGTRIKSSKSSQIKCSQLAIVIYTLERLPFVHARSI